MLVQPTAKKIASHDNNGEAVMDGYIFYNTLAVENSRLTCVRAVQMEM